MLHATLRLGLIVLISVPVLAQGGPSDVKVLSPHPGSQLFQSIQLAGKPAPELRVSGWLNSKPLTLKELEGRHVLLDFWSVHCAPCVASLPTLQALQSELGARLRIVTIHPDEVERSGYMQLGREPAAEVLPRFLRVRKFDLPVALDAAGTTAKSYGIRAYPTYFLIGPGGQVRHQSNVIPNDDTLRVLLAGE